VRAEWTKLRTVPSTVWLLLGIVAGTVALSAAYADSFSVSRCERAGGCIVDLTKVSLTGVQLGQAVVAILALLAITNEYSTRMICTTLVARPRRVAVLLSKASVVTVTVLAAGGLGVAGALLASRVILAGSGAGGAGGDPPLSLADGPTLRAAVGSVLYLGLIALLSLGIGTIVRDTAGAAITALTILYLSPSAASLISDPQWQDRLDRFAPANAGLAIQATVGVDQLPIGPWAGLGVLAAWAAVALLLGTILFTLRDA
jgi:ABC-2 type transport system permease protein